MGTKRRKPGWALAEVAPRDVVKVLNVQGIRREGGEEEAVDEGLTLWTEEYPEEKERGSRSLLTSLSASQKLSSSLDRALQCSSLLSSSVSVCSLMDIMEAIEREEVSEFITVNHFSQGLHKVQMPTCFVQLLSSILICS